MLRFARNDEKKINMRYKYILFILFASCSLFTGIQAQQVKQVTIIDDLETPVPGEGVIQITCDPQITNLIGLVSPETSVNDADYITTNGFRIQVFMSNNPKTASGELTKRGNLIKETFPDIATYRGYVAPNWKLLVGDFRTKEEADVFRQKIKHAIPELGKEMYIVPDKVNIPVQKK